MSEYRTTPFDSEIETMEQIIVSLCTANDRSSLLVKTRQDTQILMAKRDVYLLTHKNLSKI